MPMSNIQTSQSKKNGVVKTDGKDKSVKKTKSISQESSSSVSSETKRKNSQEKKKTVTEKDVTSVASPLSSTNGPDSLDANAAERIKSSSLSRKRKQVEHFVAGYGPKKKRVRKSTKPESEGGELKTNGEKEESKVSDETEEKEKENNDPDEDEDAEEDE